MKWFLFLFCLMSLSCTMYVPDFEKNHLSSFLNKNLATHEIEYLTRDSAAIFSRTDTITQRIHDTLKCGHIRIISESYYGPEESQTILINDKLVSFYERNKDETQGILSFIDHSFRHFKFKGKEFYYWEAMPALTSGGSAALIRYQLLYEVKNNKLSTFTNFRVDHNLLFGDADQDNSLDFLEISNEGGYGMDSINNFTMKIWSCNVAGNFIFQRDSAGKEYYIAGNSGTDYYVGKTFNIENYYWPVKLK